MIKKVFKRWDNFGHHHLFFLRSYVLLYVLLLLIKIISLLNRRLILIPRRYILYHYNIFRHDITHSSFSILFLQVLFSFFIFQVLLLFFVQNLSLFDRASFGVSAFIPSVEGLHILHKILNFWIFRNPISKPSRNCRVVLVDIITRVYKDNGPEVPTVTDHTAYGLIDCPYRVLLVPLRT